MVESPPSLSHRERAARVAHPVYVYIALHAATAPEKLLLLFIRREMGNEIL